MSVSSEDDMATLAAESPSTTPPFRRRRKSWARRVERVCYQVLSYFPLTFVYGLTTWAVWVQVTVSFVDASWLAYPKAFLGILLYSLANVSYSIAVFTPPGSPLDQRSSGRGHKQGEYEGLPTYEHEEEMQAPQGMSTVTAKSTGKQRYCKKCKTIKPDRTHHCSTCRQCVLKMDHHCPWLATCVGLRNYKAFLLFLIYTSMFCLTCFGVSVFWVWNNLTDRVAVDDGWRLVNTVLLSVLGGIIGLVLSGFTGWHIWLATTGATTIESLEKTRYLAPIRKSLERQLQNGRNYLSDEQANEQQTLAEHLREMHANALPGVLRPEEGEAQAEIEPRGSLQTTNGSARPTARESLQRSYASLETQREHDRYEAYLDERDSDKLPSAFDLGWKRNLLHLFGERPLLWALPVCNTTGDGWHWDVSQKWLNAREDLARQRARKQQQDARWDQHNPTTFEDNRDDLRWTPGRGFVPPPRRNYHAGNLPLQSPGGSVQPRRFDPHITSIDEAHRGPAPLQSTTDWNDVPDDLVTTAGSRRHEARAGLQSKHD